MQRARIRFEVWIATTLLSLVAPRLARGDGGIARLHGVQGPFSVTVFTAPETRRDRFTDVSVLVQRWKTGDVLLDADVSLTFNPPSGVAMSRSDPLCRLPRVATALRLPGAAEYPLRVCATRGQALNKLLYAAPVELNEAGDWRLHVVVSRGADTANFDCLVPVTLASGELSRLWPYLAFPPIAIAAFALNQWLRRPSLEKR